MPKTAKTPGSVIQKFIDDYKLTPAAVAKDLNSKNLGKVLSDKEGIDLELALRLAKYFGKPVEFWIKLQLAAYKKSLAAEVKSIPKAKKPAAKRGRTAKKPGRKAAAGKKAAADKPPARRGRKPGAAKKPAAAVKAPRAKTVKVVKTRTPRAPKKVAASKPIVATPEPSSNSFDPI